MVQGGVECTAGSELHTHCSFFNKRSTTLSSTSNDVGGMGTRLCLSASMGQGITQVVLLQLLLLVLQQVGQLVHLTLQDIWRLSLTQDEWYYLDLVGTGPILDGNGIHVTFWTTPEQRTRLEEGSM